MQYLTCWDVQSLLTAVGVGASRSLPAAAAVNWVLKDGLGRLGRLTVATSYGTSFDSDLKASFLRTMRPRVVLQAASGPACLPAAAGLWVRSGSAEIGLCCLTGATIGGTCFASELEPGSCMASAYA